jgi:hypothetical protein
MNLANQTNNFCIADNRSPFAPVDDRASEKYISYFRIRGYWTKTEGVFADGYVWPLDVQSKFSNTGAMLGSRSGRTGRFIRVVEQKALDYTYARQDEGEKHEQSIKPPLSVGLRILSLLSLAIAGILLIWRGLRRIEFGGAYRSGWAYLLCGLVLMQIGGFICFLA